MADSDESSTSRWVALGEKVFLIAVSFLLTTIVGSWLANSFQRDSATKTAELSSMQNNLTQSMALFETISLRMDKRLYAMRRVAWVYSGVAPVAELAARQAASDALRLEWNDSLNHEEALFKFYFLDAFPAPKDPCQSIVGVRSRFETVNNTQRKLHPGDKPAAEAAVRELNGLSSCIYALDNYMLDRLRDRQKQYEDEIGQ